MKYMGNKTKMLPVLGEILADFSHDAQRIADPFCGSASVSWFLAESTSKEIISGDLQSFAVARARAVVERTVVINADTLVKKWFGRARKLVDAVADCFPNHLRSIEPDLSCPTEIETIVLQSRKFCRDVLPTVFKNFKGHWAASKAYGGHYFSPSQALVFDSLRNTLPRRNDERDVALAALVEACSRAAASPGHTAQPFQPTLSSAQYIIESWLRDPWALTAAAVKDICSRTANTAGRAVIGDFAETLKLLSPGDVVFADPPYSDVHYSRFYHVLETISRGTEFEPEGVGRYPAIAQRPSSAFSRKTAALSAASTLLNSCAQKELSLVLTFPTNGASNGLTAAQLIDIGRGRFSRIDCHEIQSDFSTLGGNKKNRAARVSCGESILTFAN